MREIKFRAWLKKEKRMADVIEINFENKTISVLPKDKDMVEWANVGEGKHAFLQVEKFDIIEFMQCTHKKDKNGKEIFEGDIVRLDGECLFQVVYEDVNDDSFYYKPVKLRWYTPLSLYNTSNIEVIGNIYEKPELLEVIK